MRAGRHLRSGTRAARRCGFRGSRPSFSRWKRFAGSADSASLPGSPGASCATRIEQIAPKRYAVRSRRETPMRLVLAAAAALCALPASARTFVVHPGGSIRAAVARASPGDRIEVLPGTYREGAPGDRNALTIAVPLEIRGLSRPGAPVVLENAGAQQFGLWVSPANSAGAAEDDPEHPPCGRDGSTVRGFSLRGFTVREFAVHGVHLACVDGFSLRDNAADGNGVYGLFPVVSRHGVISGNTVTNTQTDAGIYVGQSDDVVITGNRVTGNLLGIEVENSRNCAVADNQVSGNTMGIFVDILPFLLRGTQESTLVAYN